MKHSRPIRTDEFRKSAVSSCVLQLNAYSIQYLEFIQSLTICHLRAWLLFKDHCRGGSTKRRHEIRLVVGTSHVVDDPGRVVEILEPLLVLPTIVSGWKVNLKEIKGIVEISAVYGGIGEDVRVFKYIYYVLWKLVALSSCVGDWSSLVRIWSVYLIADGPHRETKAVETCSRETVKYRFDTLPRVSVVICHEPGWVILV